jgi:hypothetical protein
MGVAWAALLVLSARRTWGLVARLDAPLAATPGRAPAGDSPSR